MEEQAIVIDQKELGIIVIVGCSHPTLEVMVEKAKITTGNNKVRGIIGGFHLADKTEDEIIESANKFKSFGIEFMAPGHCTTVGGCQILEKTLGSEIVRLSKTGTFATGNNIEINGSEILFNFV
ncbi:MAG: hypothetical protein Q9M91_00545 [Candidatus Dojkabacteria bacterium]|nr:hypothetical protein [Candidatus Dojkabacteria bacterium]MDQ7020318.1 hypothetical protein [Candidatus Dojkabacteria bacterium]